MYIDSSLLFSPIQGQAWGAAHTGTDGTTITTSSQHGPAGTTFTSGTANFAASDVGREITINAAVSGGGNLTTTIASINYHPSSTSAQLTDGATAAIGGSAVWSMAGAPSFTTYNGFGTNEIDIQTYRNIASGGPVYLFYSMTKAATGADSEAQNDFSLHLIQRSPSGGSEKVGLLSGIQEPSMIRGGFVGRRFLMAIHLDRNSDMDGDESWLQLYTWRNAANAEDMHWSAIAGLTLSPEINHLADHQY